MQTSKAPLPSAEWCRGFDAGVEVATKQLRTALLDKLATLKNDVQLGLGHWDASTLLDEVMVLVSTLDLEEEHEP